MAVTIAGLMAAGAALDGSADGKGHSHDSEHKFHMKAYDPEAIAHKHAQKKIAEQDRVLEIVEGKDGFQGYVNHLFAEGRYDCLLEGKLPPKLAGCVDEGVTEKVAVSAAGEKVRRVCEAGCGIIDLENAEGKPMDDQYIDAQADKFMEAGTFIIAPHAGCGAGNLAFKRQYDLTDEQMHGITTETIDAFCVEWAEKVVRRMKEKLEQAGRLAESEKVHMVKIVKIDRPEHLHHGEGVIVDGSGKWRGGDHMPQFFTVSAADIGLKKAMANAKISILIAFNPEHGRGKEYTEKHQFHVLCVSDQLDERKGLTQKQLEDAAREMLLTLPEDIRPRVRVEGFTCPRAIASSRPAPAKTTYTGPVAKERPAFDPHSVLGTKNGYEKKAA